MASPGSLELDGKCIFLVGLNIERMHGLYQKKHRSSEYGKAYPVVGFIFAFYSLLLLFKMGKCALLFVQNFQLVVAHHSQTFN